MANSKEPYVMLTLYQNLYKEKYNTAPKINKFREKWGMQDVIDSVGLERAIEILEYYFTLQKSGHPLGSKKHRASFLIQTHEKYYLQE